MAAAKIWECAEDELWRQPSGSRPGMQKIPRRTTCRQRHGFLGVGAVEGQEPGSQTPVLTLLHWASQVGHRSPVPQYFCQSWHGPHPVGEKKETPGQVALRSVPWVSLRQ